MPKCLTLPSRDEVADGAGDILDRHVGIDPVLVEQVDGLDAEPLQRALDRLADTLGPAVDAAVLRRVSGSMSKPNLVAITTWSRNGPERLADHLLVGERAIDLGGVEEGHAALDRGADQARRPPPSTAGVP